MPLSVPFPCHLAGNKIGGQTAALACIYLVTALLSEMLTNNAAGAIMFPIAASTAEQLGIPPNIMSVAV
jgi:di/tricarboxylate transporter